jgi:tRNA threonylcarbamoyladenosine biosynthesis protein TsaB
MQVLAVDTTSEKGSVALVEDDLVRAEVRVVARDSHSRQLLPAIEFLLATLGLGARDLGAFAVTTGPGSFTGLRVGLSTVQGLALASGRPALGLSTLEVLATLAAGRERPVVAIREAFRSEVFWSVFDASGAARGGGDVGPLDAALRAAPRGAAFVGDLGPERSAAIRAWDAEAHLVESDPYLAGPLGRLAAERLREAGAATAPEALRPVYLRGADIRTPRT